MFFKLATSFLFTLAASSAAHAIDIPNQGGLPTLLPAAVSCVLPSGSLISSTRATIWNNSDFLITVACPLPRHSPETAPFNVKVLVQDTNPTAGIGGTLKCRIFEAHLDGTSTLGARSSINGVSGHITAMSLEVPPPRPFSTYTVQCDLPRKHGQNLSELRAVYYEE
ncbi:hypothetical protein [Oryzibacter oryziterrae]|uniref:hypothetical protein n=1 Tax=Oryzibacter oryziterrae TaxID=2766474 RepID=UPI001F326D83|nr:hypothetical protein [Oryzibacter oryziterrae]